MKLGLGDSYDKVSFLSKKTRAYLDLTKPISSFGVGGAYFLGSLFYFQYTTDQLIPAGEFHNIIFVSVTMLLAHSASQAMNMAEDAEIDKNTPHKQNRPIPSGIVSEDEARTIAWFLMVFAIGRAFLINARFGSFVTVLAFMGIFYNLDPIRAKERKISIPWQAVSRGLLTFPAIWAAYGDVLDPLPWVFGIFMFWYVFGFQNSADIIDRTIDAEYGINTYVVMYGVKGVAIIAAVSILLMIFTIISAVQFNLLAGKFIFMLLIVPFCLIMLYHMAYNSDEIFNYTGNHSSWHWYYIGMVLLVIIPLAVEMI